MEKSKKDGRSRKGKIGKKDRTGNWIIVKGKEERKDKRNKEGESGGSREGDPIKMEKDIEKGGVVGESKKKKKNKSRKVERKILETVFDERLKTSKVKRYPVWEKFIEKKDGSVSIRCQARFPKAKNPPTQCKREALDGYVVCSKHGKSIKNETFKAVKFKRKDFLGLYDVDDHKLMHGEFEAMKDIPQEKLDSLTNEVNLGVAFLRRFLRETSDVEISKKPYKLFSFLETLSKIKESNWKITHSKDVVFTKEQVQYLFIRWRMAIIKIVKNQDEIQELALEFARIADEIKQTGFRI